MDHFKSLYRICYSIASVLCFGFFGREACGISAPRPGFEPTLPALKGQVLTTGPPRKSPPPLFLSHSLCRCRCELPISSLPASLLSLVTPSPLPLSVISLTPTGLFVSTYPLFYLLFIVQSLSHVCFFETPWTVAQQASLVPHYLPKSPQVHIH